MNKQLVISGNKDRQITLILQGVITVRELVAAYCRWVAERSETRSEAAQELGITVQTLRRHIPAGEPPARPGRRPAAPAPAPVAWTDDDDDTPPVPLGGLSARPSGGLAPRPQLFSREELAELAQREGEDNDTWRARVQATRAAWGK